MAYYGDDHRAFKHAFASVVSIYSLAVVRSGRDTEYVGDKQSAETEECST